VFFALATQSAFATVNLKPFGGARTFLSAASPEQEKGAHPLHFRADWIAGGGEASAQGRSKPASRISYAGAERKQAAL
jgi:hypothetical protein